MEKKDDLTERLRARINKIEPDKKPSLFVRVLEQHEFLQSQHDLGFSYDVLARVLKSEGIHIEAGTLRNYMAKARKLKGAGTTYSESQLKTHERYHASQWSFPSQSQNNKQDTAPSARKSKEHSSSKSGLVAKRHTGDSLSRKLNRQT